MVGKKLKADFTKKNLFLRFLCWGDLRVFFKAKEKFFWKIFFWNFYEIFFLIFWNFYEIFFFIFAVKDFCSSACISFTRINKKCRQNKFPSCSQIGTRNQKLHTDGFDGGDQTPARWISIWCSKTGGENLCFRSWKFLDNLHNSKSVFISFFLKKRKKVIFGQIGLDFSARQGQTVSSKIF